MAFIKCKDCNNHYSEGNLSCPFCSPTYIGRRPSSPGDSCVPSAYFDLDGTDLSILQKKMVLKATAVAQERGSHPKRNKAKSYLHHGFQWLLYDQWLTVFADSSGLEQWPAAFSLYQFEEKYRDKSTADILANLSRKRLKDFCEQKQKPWSRFSTRTQIISNVVKFSENSNLRNSAFAAVRDQLESNAVSERMELFSNWLYYGTSLKEKLADWKEFRVERVAIRPSENACVHCQKLAGREVPIDLVLPMLLRHHPGCRCEVVLATSEFSRLL